MHVVQDTSEAAENKDSKVGCLAFSTLSGRLRSTDQGLMTLPMPKQMLNLCFILLMYRLRVAEQNIVSKVETKVQVLKHMPMHTES